MKSTTRLLGLAAAAALSGIAACVGSNPEPSSVTEDDAGQPASSSGSPGNTSSGSSSGATSSGSNGASSSSSSSSGSVVTDSGASSGSSGAPVDPRCTDPIQLNGDAVQNVTCGIVSPFNKPKIDLVIGAYDLAWASRADQASPCSIPESWNASLEVVPAADGFTMHLAMKVAGVREDYTFSAVQKSQSILTVEPLCGSELPFVLASDAGAGPQDVPFIVYAPTQDEPRYLNLFLKAPNSNVRYQVRMNPR